MIQNFSEFMVKPQLLNRWRIAGTFIMGMLMGATLATIFMWSAVLI